MTIEELVRRFDDAVNALERIAVALEALEARDPASLWTPTSSEVSNA